MTEDAALSTISTPLVMDPLVAKLNRIAATIDQIQCLFGDITREFMTDEQLKQLPLFARLYGDGSLPPLMDKLSEASAAARMDSKQVEVTQAMTAGQRQAYLAWLTQGGPPLSAAPQANVMEAMMELSKAVRPQGPAPQPTTITINKKKRKRVVLD